MRRGMMGLGAGSTGPEYVGTGGQVSTPSIPVPGGVAAGDTLIFVGAYNLADWPTPPAGFSSGTSVGGWYTALYVYRKIADGSESGNLWFGTHSPLRAALFHFRGLSATEPLGNYAGGFLASDTKIRFPSLAAGTNRLLAGFGFAPGTRTVTAPTGMTTRFTSGVNTSLYVADEFPVSGTSGDRDAAISGAAAETLGITLALIPA